MDIKQDLASALSSLNIDEIIKTLSQEPPWWAYVLAALIPLSLTIVFREIFCWFWKINRILGRLRGLENTVVELDERVKRLQGVRALSGEQGEQ